jgi:hypothetical protein
VNFNGTGTVAIRASGNVSSITDNGTGDYTVNFTTAMPDANFCAVVSGTTSSESNTLVRSQPFGSYGTANYKIRASTPASNVVIDADTCFVSIFR